MNVAMCVFTHNHPDSIKKVLEIVADIYKQMKLDVYYYDSSDDDRTKCIIQNYREAGYSNLYYVDGFRGAELTPKVLAAFDVEGLHKEYEYIWPIRDRSYVLPDTLEQIKLAASMKRDVIFLGGLECISNDVNSDKLYTSATEFFLDWGYAATSLDGTIYRIDSVLANYCKETISGKCVYFPQYVALFQNIVDGMKIQLLKNEQIQIHTLEEQGSGWRSMVFEVWKDEWIKENELLPPKYDEYKPIVIKQAGNLPWVFGSVSTLKGYKNDGILCVEKLDKILNDWEMVSDIPREKIIAIASDEYDETDDNHMMEQLQTGKDEVIDIVVQLIEYLRNGYIDLESVPCGDLFDVVIPRIRQNYGDESTEYYVTVGTVRDLLLSVKQKAENVEMGCEYLQMFLSIILALQ